MAQPHFPSLSSFLPLFVLAMDDNASATVASRDSAVPHGSAAHLHPIESAPTRTDSNADKDEQDNDGENDEKTGNTAVAWDWKFWCIIASLAITQLLTAIEFTSVGTALPVITQDLSGQNYIWIGSAYNLASTALLPFCGGLAGIFGRRAVMLAAILVFMIGSALCGAATSMNFLIAGRTVQGLGAGATVSLIQIIISDMIPLKSRGIFSGIIATSFGIGAGAGPVIGGSLAGERPLALAVLHEPADRRAVCGHDTAVRPPARARCAAAGKARAARYHWKCDHRGIDNVDGVGAHVGRHGRLCRACGAVGVRGDYSEASHHPHVLDVDPHTAFSGYVQNFLSAVALSAVGYWLPVYFQACKGASPIASGVDAFGITFTVAPLAAITGALINRTHRYRAPMWFAWALIVAGGALLGTVHVDTPPHARDRLRDPAGLRHRHHLRRGALAYFFFLRQFALIWGVTIGGTILQNKLTSTLPDSFLAEFPGGTQIAFAIIPSLGSLPPPLRAAVRDSFAHAFRLLWRVLAGLGGAGLLSSLVMKGLRLHTEVGRDVWPRGGPEGCREAVKRKMNAYYHVY
ncbi:MFS general substrate transporter [Mycena indigotica]|uniref:MFS general substrate transporter n=1 Tax=Mycena indigotica TaxID=2126181 RepID=A0A8H6SP90_9AGAR|nr:MFS general substrate transporter [Mycena indigotica]KAF7303485.1 MFS general substrate transporter [Mycena indigotica]